MIAKRTKQLIINVGVSGAGKTTWTTKYIKENPNFLRINRDDIRTTLKGTLDGYYKLKSLSRVEEIINELEMQMFLNMMDYGFDVIIDNTNLKPSYVERWMSFVKFWNGKFAEEQGKIEVIFKIFPEKDVTLLRKRVDVRDAPIDPKALDYINKQVQSLDSIVHYIQDNYKESIITSG